MCRQALMIDLQLGQLFGVLDCGDCYIYRSYLCCIHKYNSLANMTYLLSDNHYPLAFILHSRPSVLFLKLLGLQKSTRFTRLLALTDAWSSCRFRAARTGQIDQVHLGTKVVFNGSLIVATVPPIALIARQAAGSAAATRRRQAAPLLQRDGEDRVRARRALVHAGCRRRA